MRDAAQDVADAQSATGRVQLDPGHTLRDSQCASAGVDLPPGQTTTDTHGSSAGGSLGTDHRGRDNQEGYVGASSCGDHSLADTQMQRVVAPHDGLLLILADALDDLERVRIATDNRIRSLAQVKGLDDSPESKRLSQIRDGIAALEHDATLDLQRTMRTHPLGPWVKRTIGVGEKQAARLLAALGDPAARPNPAKLWQYAGHGDPKRSRQSKDNVTYMETEDGKTVVVLPFSPTGKMRTWMVAESAVKAGVRKLDGCDDSDGYDLAHRKAITPLGQVYLDARAKWADRTGCPSCKGDCSDGHKHAHALRVVGKAMLLDLWREARNLRGDQDTIDIHAADVPAANLPSANGAALPIAGSPTAELEGEAA